MATLTKNPALKSRTIPALIKSKAGHERAIQRISELIERDPAPGSEEGDELELLAHLAEEYEKKNFSIGLPDPISAIQFCLEQRGLTPNDLVPFLGTKSRVSEILAGKRPLTLAMIRKLHEGLGIPTDVLVGERKARPADSVEALRCREDVPLRQYRVTLRQSEEGWAVSCPVLPGCHSQGDTREEAIENIKEAIRAWLAVDAEQNGVTRIEEELVAI